MLHQTRNYQINYFCGWQYIFSKTFRSQVHQKWGGNLWLQSLCIIGAIGGMVISLAVFVFLISASWELLNHL